jgi:crotonobetainyl-CoA:carnitine CoA-transferase CaiB-like acyl-CoA transferase
MSGPLTGIRVVDLTSAVLGPVATQILGDNRFDVPNGVVTDLEGLLADPYHAETGFFEPVEHPSEGKMLTMAVPIAFSATPGESFRLPPPRLGEHTSEVLADIDYSEADIEKINA